MRTISEELDIWERQECAKRDTSIQGRLEYNKTLEAWTDVILSKKIDMLAKLIDKKLNALYLVIESIVDKRN